VDLVDGTYGRGSDPIDMMRCADGGVPISCDKQLQFERAFDRIAKAIEDDQKKQRSPASGTRGSTNPGSSSERNPNQIHESIHGSGQADATTSTNKPASDPTTSGAVEPASL